MDEEALDGIFQILPQMSPETGPLSDCCGGSLCASDQIAAVSALTGETLFWCNAASATEKGCRSLPDIIRSTASALFCLPYFACDVLLGNGILADNITWAEAGMPQQALVVLKQRSSAWTDDLMEAISSTNELEVRRILGLGQDPCGSTWLREENPLTLAAVKGTPNIVRLLVQGRADIDAVPRRGRMAPLHWAAISSHEVVAALLSANANPNRRDVDGMTPLGHAFAVSTPNQLTIAKLLLDNGADPLIRDCQEETAFSLAPPGKATSMCLDHSWDKICYLDIFQRHIEQLGPLCWNDPWWSACSAMRSQRLAILHLDPTQDVLGGSSTVLFSLATTGQEICTLDVDPECHRLPFSVACGGEAQGEGFGW